MTNPLEIIKQKGIGEYLGLCETNLDVIENYPQYVEMSLELESKKYFVELLTNKPFSYLEKSLYEGYDEKIAKKIFNKAIEDNRIKVKPKENKLEELSKN